MMHGGEINRWDPWYWINGAGAWMNRWDCSGGDVPCNSALICTTILLCILHVIFAVQNHRQLKSLPEDSPFRSYCRRKRSVFLWCGVLHFMGKCSNFVTPIHWMEVLVCGYACIQTARLAHSRYTIDSVEQFHQGRLSIAARRSALEQLGHVSPETLEEAMAALERLRCTLAGTPDDDFAANTA